MMPFSVTLTNPEGAHSSEKARHLPVSLQNGSTVRVTPSTTESYQKVYTTLLAQYDEIVVVLASDALTHGLKPAEKAIAAFGGRPSIFLVDSGTVSIGQGLLVQLAARAALSGMSGNDIRRLLLGASAHVYSAFCVRGLTYLQQQSMVRPSQAYLGEMLKVMPFYVLEDNAFTPMLKVRNARHMVDVLYEFASEFSEIGHLAIVQSVPPYESEIRVFRERITEDYPELPISEHKLNARLAGTLGPQTLSLFVWETNDYELKVS